MPFCASTLVYCRLNNYVSSNSAKQFDWTVVKLTATESNLRSSNLFSFEMLFALKIEK